MNSIELHRKVINRDILVSMVKTDDGIQVMVAGGDKAHIGAVTIIDPQGNEKTVCFSGHREDIITLKWARRVYSITSQPVVISAGIHYDNASKEMIAQIVAGAESLLDELCNIIIDII